MKIGGTGMSCFADHSICSSGAIYLADECRYRLSKTVPSDPQWVLGLFDELALGLFDEMSIRVG